MVDRAMGEKRDRIHSDLQCHQHSPEASADTPFVPLFDVIVLHRMRRYGHSQHSTDGEPSPCQPAAERMFLRARQQLSPHT